MIYTIIYKEELYGPYSCYGDEHVKRSNPFLRLSIYHFIKDLGKEYDGKPINAVFQNGVETDILVFTKNMFKSLSGG